MTQPIIPQDWGSQGASETITRNFDCSAILSQGDKIATLLGLTSSFTLGGPSADLVLAAPAVDPSGRIVSFLCSGGSYGSGPVPRCYYVTLSVATAAGETLVRSAMLTIAPN